MKNLEEYIDKLNELRDIVEEISNEVGNNSEVQNSIEDIILQIVSLTNNIHYLNELKNHKIGFLTFLKYVDV